MEFFTIAGGISVHVWDTGDEGVSSSGKTILLLHGYLETMYVFNELVEALKPYYRVIALDLPGHGLTDSAPADAKGIRVNTVQFDVPVIAGVMEKCGVSKALIAGHSMGGYITLECIKDRPELFERAILLNSHPFPDLPEMEEKRKREIEVVAGGKLLQLAELSVPRMYFSENLRVCDEKIRETAELCETHNPEGIIASIRGIQQRPDLQSVMLNPPVPLTLIHGDHDNFLPMERVEEMKQKFDKVEYRLIPSTGHNSFIENLPEVVKALTAYC